MTEQLRGLMNNFTTTLEALISAEAHSAAQTDKEPDDMGAYYEEQAFEKATEKLFTFIEESRR